MSTVDLYQHVLHPLNFKFDETKKVIPHRTVLIISALVVGIFFSGVEGFFIVFYGVSYALKSRQIHILEKKQKADLFFLERVSTEKLSLPDAMRIMKIALYHLEKMPSSNKSVYLMELKCFIAIAEKRDILIDYVRKNEFVFSSEDAKKRILALTLQSHYYDQVKSGLDPELKKYNDNAIKIMAFFQRTTGNVMPLHPELNDVIPSLQDTPFAYSKCFLKAFKCGSLENLSNTINEGICLEAKYDKMLEFLTVSDPEWNINYDSLSTCYQVIGDVFRRYKYQQYQCYFKKTYNKDYNFDSQSDKQTKEKDYIKLTNEDLEITKEGFIDYFCLNRSENWKITFDCGSIDASNFKNLIDEVATITGMFD